MSDNANSPASPTPYMDFNPNCGSELHCDNEGLTKREHFAGLAMQMLNGEDYSGKEWAINIAKDSIELADAFLTQLDKQA